jgi:hypothetical protein
MDLRFPKVYLVVTSTNEGSLAVIEQTTDRRRGTRLARQLNDAMEGSGLWASLLLHPLCKATKTANSKSLLA